MVVYDVESNNENGYEDCQNVKDSYGIQTYKKALRSVSLLNICFKEMISIIDLMYYSIMHGKLKEKTSILRRSFFLDYRKQFNKI